MRSWVLPVGVAAVLIVAGCSRSPGPEETAVAYGRALYANDADTLWQLISEADRREKDEATFRRQQQQLNGFTREVVERLSRHIAATPVKTSVSGDRMSVTLKFRLPDANAPVIRTLMHDWDEERLNQLSDGERARVRDRLDALARENSLPTIEGDETMQLVREAGAWRVFLNWAGGVRVTFAAATAPGMPVDVRVTPATAVLAPGERLRVTVTAKNTTPRDVTTRVTHRTDPETAERYLALLQCPLLLPVRLAPGESQEFVSEYLLLGELPPGVKSLTVTTDSLPAKPSRDEGGRLRRDGSMLWRLAIADARARGQRARHGRVEALERGELEPEDIQRTAPRMCPKCQETMRSTGADGGRDQAC